MDRKPAFQQTELLNELLHGTADPLAWLCTIEEEEAIANAIRLRFPRGMPYKGAALFDYTPDARTWPAPLSDVVPRARPFLDLVAAEVGLLGADQLTVLWDDLDYLSISLPYSLFLTKLEDLLEMPSHMFVLPTDLTWCLAFRTIGDMGLCYSVSAAAL